MVVLADIELSDFVSSLLKCHPISQQSQLSVDEDGFATYRFAASQTRELHAPKVSKF